MIEILTGGALNSVQDLGRHGHLSQGIGASGAMDGLALRIGNALLGNDAGSAGIEIAIFPFRLRFLAETAFALTGADCRATLDNTDLPPWWASRAEAGQVLILAPPESGARAYLCLQGGIDVPVLLGSRAADLKGGFGGFEGRGLVRGDRLSLLPKSGPVLALPGIGAKPPMYRTSPALIRVLPAAQFADFTAEARDALGEADWEVTADTNRTGMRLTGPVLTLQQPMELFSRGIVPGTIQVPSAGQPIVQMAEANSAGGYPVIATVIEADLWRLAQVPIGGNVRFEMVSRDEAIDALAELAALVRSVERGVALAQQT